MDISAQVLRDVEFSGSLRGYNTDEVDEFLEQVAVGVDSLQAELRGAVEQAGRERPRPEPTGAEGEESIRRILVLAQRTADLAIRESQEEAALIMEQARVEAEAVLSEAQDSAEQLAASSLQHVRDEVARLTTLRESLKTETDSLVSILSAERVRLTESLSTALRFVERTLTTPAAISSGTTGAAAIEEAGDAVEKEGDASAEDSTDGVESSPGDALEELAESEPDERRDGTAEGAAGVPTVSAASATAFPASAASIAAAPGSGPSTAPSTPPQVQPRYDREPVAMAVEGASEYDRGALSGISSPDSQNDGGRRRPFKRKPDW